VSAVGTDRPYDHAVGCRGCSVMITSIKNGEMSGSEILHPVVIEVPSQYEGLHGRAKVDLLRRLARQALCESARHAGLILGALEKDEKGAPVPVNGIHWSLTHKDAYVAAVAACRPIGIDLERIKPFSPGLLQRLAAAGEWNLAPEVDARLFFRFWTAKEAVLKAVGQGMTGLSHCRILEILDDSRLRVSYKKELWTVVHHWIDHQHLASITAENEPLEWHLSDAKPL
jgi:4'-phosphopantetheinyl transferase